MILAAFLFIFSTISTGTSNTPTQSTHTTHDFEAMNIITLDNEIEDTHLAEVHLSTYFVKSSELDSELEGVKLDQLDKCPDGLFSLTSNFFKPVLKLCHASKPGFLVAYPPRPKCEVVKKNMDQKTCPVKVLTWAPAVEEKIIDAVHCYKTRVTKVCTFYFFGAKERRHESYNVPVEPHECPNFPEQHENITAKNIHKINEHLYYKGKFPNYECYWPASHLTTEDIIYIERVKISIGRLHDGHTIISPLINPHNCSINESRCSSRDLGIVSWRKSDFPSHECNLTPLSIMTCTLRVLIYKPYVQIICDKHKTIFHFSLTNNTKGLTLLSLHNSLECTYASVTYKVHRSLENYALSFLMDSTIKDNCLEKLNFSFVSNKVTYATYGHRVGTNVSSDHQVNGKRRKREIVNGRLGRQHPILRFHQGQAPLSDCEGSHKGDTPSCTHDEEKYLEHLKQSKLFEKEQDGYQSDLSTSELSWYGSKMSEKRAEDLTILHHEQCLLRQEEWDLMENLKKTNPDGVVKYWMGSPYWFGRLIRGNMEVWKCKKVNKYMLAANSSEHHNWPIIFEVEGRKLAGYVDANTLEIRTNKGDKMPRSHNIPLMLNINETHHLAVYEGGCKIITHSYKSSTSSYLEDDIIYSAPLFNTLEETLENEVATLEDVMAQKMENDVGYREFSETNKETVGFDAVKIGFEAGVLVSSASNTMSSIWHSLTSGFYGWILKLIVIIGVFILLLILFKCALHYKPRKRKMGSYDIEMHTTPRNKRSGNTYM